MKTVIVVVVLIVLVAIGSTVGYLVGTSAQRTVTSATTSVSTTTTSTTVTETRTTSVAGAEGEALDAQGIELLLGINSTMIRPNGTISITVEDFNVLSTSNNVSAASEWRVQGLTWECGQSWSTNDMGIMRGYYTLNNISTGSFLFIWPPIFCPVEWVFNSTGGIVGAFRNATSYSFLPNGDQANVTVYYTPINASGTQTGLVERGTFGPYHLGGPGWTISATQSSSDAEGSLGSSAPGVYTIVGADEWGNLVLLHFSVVSP